MHGRRAYLDWNASAPLLPEARAAMLDALDLTANASSVHAEGRKARQIVEAARRDVAALCGADPAHLVFTSGASEAASLVLTPNWRMGRAPLAYSKLYVAASDHSALLGGGRFDPQDIIELQVDSDGIIDVEALAQVLGDHDKSAGLPLVAVHLANNETGVIQPARRIADIVHAAGGLLVLDAVQAGGRIGLDIAELGADWLILGAHKLGGPKGAGALVGRSDVLMPAPISTGGGQERGHRPGTENHPAIAGFGAAARRALQKLPMASRLLELRGRFETLILKAAPDAVIFGAGAQRLPNTIFFALPGVKAETMQIAFDLAGIAVSAGSACSSGKVSASRVLKAMGLGEGASGIRVSFGHATGEDELAAFGAVLMQFVSRRSSAA
jgi:cysteine desulfurase